MVRKGSSIPISKTKQVKARRSAKYLSNERKWNHLLRRRFEMVCVKCVFLFSFFEIWDLAGETVPPRARQFLEKVNDWSTSTCKLTNPKPVPCNYLPYRDLILRVTIYLP